MAKEVAISKRLKISEAEQYIILAVLAASLVLGVCASLVIHFIEQISFNTSVIMAEEQTIASYSKVIKNTGVCKKPKGEIYTDEELRKCDPASIEVSEIPNTLRSNIITNLSVNEALSSVSKQNDTTCIDRETGKNYTLKRLNEIYDAAVGASELQAASNLIKSCSALRVIPDALPAFKNEEALLASLNKLFLLSGWTPEVLRPNDSDDVPILSDKLNTIPVSLSVESTIGTTRLLLTNIERSIRDFDIYRATIEWGSNDTLVLQARAAAYYVDPSAITESTLTVSGKTGKATTGKGGSK